MSGCFLLLGTVWYAGFICPDMWQIGGSLASQIQQFLDAYLHVFDTPAFQQHPRKLNSLGVQVTCLSPLDTGHRLALQGVTPRGCRCSLVRRRDCQRGEGHWMTRAWTRATCLARTWTRAICLAQPTVSAVGCQVLWSVCWHCMSSSCDPSKCTQWVQESWKIFNWILHF